MRIGFDAAPIFSTYGGIGQYVRSLFPIMVSLESDIEWVGYLSKRQIGKRLPDQMPSAISFVTSSPRPFWKWGGGSEPSMDLFHGTNFKAQNYGQRVSIISIHDLWLTRNPQYSKKMFGQSLSTWKLGRRAWRAQKVITGSYFSAREIHEVFGVSLQNISVIHNGCSPEMYVDRDEGRFRDLQRRLGLPDRPYLLFLGGAEPRKNHRLLFRAFAQSKRLQKEFSLLAIGNVESRGDNLLRTAREYGIGDHVQCPGFVPDNDLRLLYSFAEVFVFPSLYEGFGFPAVEAMACGAPVVLTDNTSLPEVGGDAAWYVSPWDSEQLTDCLERLVFDKIQRQQMTEMGLQQAGQFTWEKTARETLAVYQETIMKK
jgi:glycosyltransferase involved in cell wall biosynthesis